MTKIKAEAADAGKRIDKFLQEKLQDFSRTDIQKLISAAQVFLLGKAVSKNLKVEEGMEFEILSLPQKEASALEPEAIPLDIVYEDDDMVVLNKPRNLVVHPGNGVHRGTLAAGLLHHFKENLSSVNGALRPGIVHRLDKDTAGLMVVAKNDFSHRHLAAQLETRSLSRVYHALVWGIPRDLEGLVDAPMARDPRNRLKMNVVSGGKEARTHFQVKETFQFCSLVRLKLETGRTHQIRVHMRYMGNPVVGDAQYDGRETCLQRVPPLIRDGAATLLEMNPSQYLQAVKIELIHPRTGKRLAFEVPHEPVFQKALDFLRAGYASEIPDAEMVFFKSYDAKMRYEEPEEEEEMISLEEMVPRKERLTRAERFVKKKERLARKKELEQEKMLKKAVREAIKRGEDPDKIVLPGHEPTME
ncbi:MAG: RluA family pseudouridine synthase [Fibrobacter sp.]|jgi:23S rRNA pseudouridine1911/1915/1917 synthase|nr:RluA family pseudouridine synthase [Fibrobacter sp.]